MKKYTHKIKISLLSLLILVGTLLILGGCANNKSTVPTPPEVLNTIELKVVTTSDMHDYLMNYDYYTTSESDNYGLVKLATLIKDYRTNSGSSNNIVLVDNGDLIQGNPLGDYFARVQPVKPGETHPIYAALESLGYDAIGLGNHEFNYGLDFLHQIINDTKIPVLNANVYNSTTKQNEFKPYTIVEKTYQDANGKNYPIKVGIISFVPTQILNWDKLHLEGKVTVQDIKACASEFIPKMKAEGADVIIALAHTGYGSDSSYLENSENMAYHLTTMDDIDIVVGGHSHEIFPSEGFVEQSKFQNIDLSRGTINDTFSVQPPKYAEGLGVVTLHLMPTHNGYKLTDGNVEIVSAKGISNDADFQQQLAASHQKVIDYVNGPVGKTTVPLNSFFALATDNASVQLVSDAQLAYAKAAVRDAEELKAYQNLPILSAAAPFKAGLSKDGTKADDYVNIPVGDIAIKDVANLYKYPNTAVILKVTGADILEWLEMSAGMFNQIDTSLTTNQELFNSHFPAYNFDTIDGVTYEIDVTKPSRYDVDGNLLKPVGDSGMEEIHRIINLKYKDQPIQLEDEFLVITNNYRGGGGGNFPIFSTPASKIVYSSSDETRQIIADYIASQGTISPKADNNWQLAPTTSGAHATFLSSTEGTKYLEDYPFLKVSTEMDNGLTEYLYEFISK